MQEIFHEAVARPSAERRAFLESACVDDPSLIEEVLSMLTEDDTGDSFLDRALPEIAYEMVGTDLPPSQEFGPYRLKRILGEGGMGVVWLAERADVGNLVAIKFLPHAGLSPARRERFLQETRTLARLTHPFIARLYDAGALADGTPWFVMEYVDGIPLNRYLDEHPAPIEDRLRLFRKVCEAVQYAHGQTIVHRDLKPSNILVQADGTPKLLDFGIARELQEGQQDGDQTRPGPRFMSPHYSAPEWIRDGVVGLTTDVYSLGVMLYQILALSLPEHSEAQETAPAQPRKPSIEAAKRDGALKLPRTAWTDLDAMCLKAMHDDRTRRYLTAEALIRDIDHFLNGEPLEARPDSTGYKLSKFLRRNRNAVLAIAAALVILLALVAGFTWRLAKARNVALASAAKAERMQRFMLDLFQGNDPDAGPSADLRVSEVIDRGVLEARSLSAEPEVQADLYQTLGTMYQKLGKLDKADALLQLGANQARSPAAQAENQIALALLRSDQGKSQDAETLARRALATAQAGGTAGKASLTNAESALGHVLVVAGKYDEGARMLQQALALEEKSTPPPPQYAQDLTGLADAQLYLGHDRDSESLNLRALAINRQIHGENHPAVAELRGNFKEAVSYAQQAFNVDAAWYGKDNPTTAGAMTTLASLLNQESRYSESETLLEQALAIQRKTFGDRSTHVAYVLNALGSLELYRRDFPKAIEYDNQSVETYRSALGDADYRVAVVMGNLASVYGEEKDYPHCEAIMKQVVQRMLEALPADNLNTAEARVRLGRTLMHEKKYQESLDYTLAAYDSLIKQANPELDFVRGARQDLAIDYEALHQPVEAKKYRAELASSSLPSSKPPVKQ